MFDPTEPLYASLSMVSWNYMQKTGIVPSSVQITNSMRISQISAVSMANQHASGKAMVVRLDGQKFFAEHGNPSDVQHFESHRENEFCFSWLKNQFSRFEGFVESVYEIAYDFVEVVLEDIYC